MGIKDLTPDFTRKNLALFSQKKCKVLQGFRGMFFGFSLDFFLASPAAGPDNVKFDFVIAQTGDVNAAAARSGTGIAKIR